MKNDFNYKWSKIFASKRFKREDGFIILAPIEQHELLKDAESLVEKLTLTSVGSGFKVGTYTLIKQGCSKYTHWSKGLKMVIEKDGVVMELEGKEIEDIVKSLPRTIGGKY